MADRQRRKQGKRLRIVRQTDRQTDQQAHQQAHRPTDTQTHRHRDTETQIAMEEREEIRGSNERE